MANTVWNSTTSSPSTFQNNTLSQNSRLVRLVEDPDIKKDIPLDELSLSDTGSSSNNGNSQMSVVGNVYPIIRINDMIMGEDNIKSMTISSTGFFPTITLDLAFSTTKMISKDMPKDGDIVSIYIRTNTDAINYLRDDFIITSCDSKVNSKNSFNRVHLTGKLFIEGIDSPNNVFGVIGTSKTVMKEVAKKFKMGFAFNDSDDTHDLQNWLCCYQAPSAFINNVTLHSWKNSTSFFKTWIDFYYNLCFVNVNKFLSSEENPEDEIDITFNSKTNDMNGIINESTGIDNAEPVMKVLTNDFRYKNSPFYIKSWKPINNSYISQNTGYTNKTYSFVHNQNVYNTDKDACCDTLKANPIYDTNKIDSYILLRGRAKYDENKNPDNEQKRVNYNMTETYVTHTWSGIEYKMDEDEDASSNNTWSGNVHQNYNIAQQHNLFNISELNKLYIQVVCEGLCLQIMRGERIPVYLEYNTPVDRNTVSNTAASAEFNKFYSGYYIIDSLEYKYNGNKADGYSSFSTIVTLKRREWPTPEDIQKDPNENLTSEEQEALYETYGD